MRSQQQLLGAILALLVSTTVLLALAGCNANPQPGAAWITGIEVTQGIQTTTNKIPLIAFRQTFVRVYIAGRPHEGGVPPQVGASLEFHGQTYAPVRPAPLQDRSFHPTQTLAAPPQGSDRRSLDDSFLFQLDGPPPLAVGGERTVHGIGPGTYEIKVTLTQNGAAGATWTQRVTFGPTDRLLDLKVYGVRYGYPTQPARQKDAQKDACKQLTATAENLLPVAQLTVDPIPADTPADLVTDKGCTATEDDDKSLWTCEGVGPAKSRSDNALDEARNSEVKMIDHLCPGGGCYIMVLQPETTTGGAGLEWTTEHHNCAMNMRGEDDTVPLKQGFDFAHELLHCFSLGHAPDVPEGPDPNYPRPDPSIRAEVGLRYTPDYATEPGQDASGQSTRLDLMSDSLLDSQSGRKWISPYDYCMALRVVSRGTWVCPPDADPPDADPSSPKAIEDFDGTWINEDPKTTFGLTRLILTHQESEVTVQAYSTCTNKVCLLAHTHPYSPEKFGCTSLLSCAWGTRTKTYHQGPLIIDFPFSSVTHKVQMSFTQRPHIRLLVGDVGALPDGGNYRFYFHKQASSSTGTATPTGGAPGSPTATAELPTPVPPAATATPSSAPPTLNRQVVRQTYPVATGAGFAAHVKCPAGTVAVDGGFYPDPGINVSASYPVTDATNPTSSWEVYGSNGFTTTQSIYAYAVCASA